MTARINLVKGDSLHVAKGLTGHVCETCNRLATVRVRVNGDPSHEHFWCEFDAGLVLSDARQKGVGVLGDGMIRQ